MGIKAVVFDMDGVLFDTECLAETGWLAAGKECDFPITVEQIGEIRGKSVAASRKLFSQWYGAEFDYDGARRVRTEYVEEIIRREGMPVKEGVVWIMEALKERGILRGLATSTQRETVLWYFEQAYIPCDFDTIVCGPEVKRSKPFPDIFLKAMENLGILPAETLIVEDSFHGIRAGAAAGSRVIMVPDMDQPDEEIKKLCYGICEKLPDLIKFIK